MIALGILRVHKEYVGNDEKTEFTICNLPTRHRNIDVDEDRFGLVVPMGKPKYMNRMSQCCI
jgi:hypothetical protein